MLVVAARSALRFDPASPPPCSSRPQTLLCASTQRHSHRARRGRKLYSALRTSPEPPCSLAASSTLRFDLASPSPCSSLPQALLCASTQRRRHRARRARKHYSAFRPSVTDRALRSRTALRFDPASPPPCSSRPQALLCASTQRRRHHARRCRKLCSALRLSVAVTVLVVAASSALRFERKLCSALRPSVAVTVLVVAASSALLSLTVTSCQLLPTRCHLVCNSCQLVGNYWQ
jgi:hypothetical protein